MGLNYCFPVWLQNYPNVDLKLFDLFAIVWVPWLKSLDSGSVTLGNNYNAIWLNRWNHWFLNWGPGTHRGPWPIAEWSANICYINLKKIMLYHKKYRFGSFTSTKQEYSASNPSHIIFKQVTKKKIWYVCEATIQFAMKFLFSGWNEPSLLLFILAYWPASWQARPHQASVENILHIPFQACLRHKNQWYGSLWGLGFFGFFYPRWADMQLNFSWDQQKTSTNS